MLLCSVAKRVLPNAATSERRRRDTSILWHRPRAAVDGHILCMRYKRHSLVQPSSKNYVLTISAGSHLDRLKTKKVAAIQLREERWQRRRLGEDGGVGEAKETWTWLLDMEGAGPGDSPGLRTLRTLDEILAAHYPAKLGIVLVVNASGTESKTSLYDSYIFRCL